VTTLQLVNKRLMEAKEDAWRLELRVEELFRPAHRFPRRSPPPDSLTVVLTAHTCYGGRRYEGYCPPDNAEEGRLALRRLEAAKQQVKSFDDERDLILAPRRDKAKKRAEAKWLAAHPPKPEYVGTVSAELAENGTPDQWRADLANRGKNVPDRRLVAHKCQQGDRYKIIAMP
jgi:hypothetical protein